MGKVILVSSGKGGTGKTMFSVNLGAVLAQREKRVILIDLDMGLRNMDIYLGMENKVVYNIMDVVSGICRIKKAQLLLRETELSMTDIALEAGFINLPYFERVFRKTTSLTPLQYRRQMRPYS